MALASEGKLLGKASYACLAQLGNFDYVIMLGVSIANAFFTDIDNYLIFI